MSSAVLSQGQEVAAILSKALLASATLALPLAFLALARGFSGPFVLAVMALAAAFYALTCHRNEQTAAAHAVLLLYILGSGTALIIVSPALPGYGLALLVLGIVFLGLTGGRFPARLRRVLIENKPQSNSLSGPRFLSADRSAGTRPQDTWLSQTRSKAAGLAGIGIAVYAGTIVADIPQLLQAPAPMELAAAFVTLSISTALAYIAYAVHQPSDGPASKENSAVRHLASHMGDGYLRFSLSGDVEFASAATQKLLGCPTYELSGRGFAQRVHVGDQPAFLKCLSDAVHEGGERTLELRVRKDDVARREQAPEYIWIEASLSLVSDPEIARPEREIVALLRDICRRKRHELETVAAREAAEEASSTKSRFLATIGHELRTPLNAIVGFSEMMSNGIGGTLQPTHLEYAGLIEQSGHHLLDVVNMLLDMSRIEAGKFELQLTEFEPKNLVKPCVHMIEASAREKNIRLTVELPDLLPAITGDERACRQILINLLSNAVKFSHEESEVTLRIKRQGQKLALSVCDTGIGMSREAASRVGEPFFQVHDALSRKYEGTGLGMSIVKGLVDLHQGTMRVKSRSGEGTQVTIFLPVHGPQIATAAPETVTILHQNPNKTEPAPWPEQKSLAR